MRVVQVIADNIRQCGTISGDVNPMVPGQKVMAIFGFCDIRQFTDATEVLQVRTISDTLHKVVLVLHAHVRCIISRLRGNCWAEICRKTSWNS